MPDPTPAPTAVNVVSRDGTTRVAVPSDKLAGYLAEGYHVEQDPEARARVDSEARSDTYGGTGNAILAGGLRGLGTATFGASDAALRAAGAQDFSRDLSAEHPYASLIGDVAGAFATPGIGKLGSAIGDAAGGGILGGIAGQAAEGAAYGVGGGVSQLALSNDPLTAEHIASVLSSNALLGGGIGGVTGAGAKLFERGLQIAGDKLAAGAAARGALEGIPEDLQALDDIGLKDAFTTAKAAHAAEIQAERDSLQAVRVGERAEVAKQVKALHEDLATERPIFQALSQNDELTPALKGIEGVSDARVQLAKSFKSLRSALDSPISAARDPFPLIRPLEQRQAALEALQQKLPEMHAALAGDARAEVLQHIDTALEETKQQITTIRTLKEAPLASPRLAALEGAPSSRMEAITAARDALKNGPELGLVGKGAKGAAFAGATALAHMIPGVGFAAPFVGKAAADAVEKMFTRAAGAVGKVEGKAASAAQKFLGGAKSLETYVAPTSTRVLAAVKFAPSKNDVPEGDLVALYRQRSSELFSQTMRQPDGTTVMRPEARQAMAAKLDPIRQVNPLLADKIETVKARATAYLASIAPRKPEPAAVQFGPDTSRASDMAIRAWARSVRAVEDPASVEERLARGIVTPEEAQCYRTVYPERFAALQREIFQAAPTLEKTLPMAKKVALSIFTGVPVTPAMQPNVLAVLQSTFDVEPGTAGGSQAPRPQPNFGSLGSLKDMDKPTPAQKRQEQR